MLSNFDQNMQNRELCEFYLNPDDLSKFCVGYILEKDESHCLIACLDPYGKRDGFCCFRIEDLIKVQTDTKYLICLKKLLVHNRDNGFFEQKIQLQNAGAPLIDRVFHFIQRENKVSSFEILGGNVKDFYGTISDISDRGLIIQAISDYACTDGCVFIDRETISAVAFDSCDEWKIEILYRWGLADEASIK